MKFYAIISAVIFLAMLFVPLFSLLGGNDTHTSITFSAENTSNADMSEISDVVKKQDSEKDKVRVLRTASGKVENVDMKSYVICCVASEMPPTYNKEALKAQAVVSYTYALYLLSDPFSSDADITDDPARHQAYKSESEIKESWGENYDTYIKLIEEAVNEVEGQYLTYDGKIIKSAYHAMSSGKTNSALDVWGSDLPYLRSVTSDGDRLSPKFISTYEFSGEQMLETLCKFSGKKIESIDIGDSVTNSGGYVKSIDISGLSFSGEELRSAFSLRSGAFVLEKDGDIYKFTCSGYGHGVGMSQNGAQYMAQNSSTYDEILKHYYTGVEIKS